MKANPRVEILIDELVLYGFVPAERYAIGEALSQELERLVAAQNTESLAALKDVANMRANNIALAAGAKPQTIGAQVAQSIHASLGIQAEATQ